MLNSRRPVISLLVRTLDRPRSYVIPSYFTMDRPHSNPNRAPRWRSQKKAATRRSDFHAASRLQNAASAAAAAVAADVDAVAGAPQPSSAMEVPLAEPKFSTLSKLIHPQLLETLTKDMKFQHMTPVQAATLGPLLTERADILAQAKTGTGKTVAFLLPAIQHIIESNQKAGAFVSVLVITPTRELALQIAAEAKTLLRRFPQYKICTAIGGTNKNTEMARLRSGCDILIGTPGRIYDHMETPESTLVPRLQKLQSLVLDEADRLLDMGFLHSIKQIIARLPNKNTSKRQGVLFSATVPDRVKGVAHLALNDGYKFISTIAEGDLNTHERVPQEIVEVPEFSDQAAALIDTIRHELQQVGRDSFKAIVFAPTAQLVEFFAEIIKRTYNDLGTEALHSRMSQPRRIRFTEAFRNAKSGVLVATDVIARGMDFPAVTNVIQVGLPFDKETYVHRLGRTARAGADGRGTLILAKPEMYFQSRELKGINMTRREADLSSREAALNIAKTCSFSATPAEAQTKVYQAWLGFYKSYARSMGWDNARLVKEANRFAKEGLGAPSVPKLPKNVVGKMGLKGVHGLIVG
ncbi:P-loop containing nucleoside triphosphate hydrolase protein [Biscogniauxia sp. FL1348]|nr:P-loop containing nucleoside triphosphate hydrolase protein [Biscogniauxia sp. FL1348]